MNEYSGIRMDAPCVVAVTATGLFPLNQSEQAERRRIARLGGQAGEADAALLVALVAREQAFLEAATAEAYRT